MSRHSKRPWDSNKNQRVVTRRISGNFKIYGQPQGHNKQSPADNNREFSLDPVSPRPTNRCPIDQQTANPTNHTPGHRVDKNLGQIIARLQRRRPLPWGTIANPLDR